MTPTTFCEVFGIDLPIIQAPMAGVQNEMLAIAVCVAGGLGSIPAAMIDAATLRAQIRRLREATARPFNVNFFCHEAPRPDADRDTRWHARFRPYYEELGVPFESPAGATRGTFNEEMAGVIDELRPPVVSFHFGLPAHPLVQRVRAAGTKILSSATTVEEAKWLAEHGVDAIIAQGVEAGGHRGMFLTNDITTQIGTLALVPQIVDAVGLPVIAAGGITDPRSAAAAIRLGAAAVQAGTAYLLSPEATTSAVHRAAVASDRARHTALTNVMTGRPARGIVNRVMRELGPMNDGAPAFPLASSSIGPLRTAAEARGSGDFSPLWCGQAAPQSSARPAAEITRDIGRAALIT